jgi:two-component system response regulator (stage 0 sporulation protein A)
MELLASKRKYRVVVADNNRNYLELIRDYFKKMNDFEIVAYAFDGKEACELAKLEKPDLFIVDLILPVIDGFGVIENIRSNKELSHTKIIMISAISLDFVVKKAARLGIDYFFIKPFDIEIFKKRVIEVMSFLPARNTEEAYAETLNDQPKSEETIITRLIQQVSIKPNVKGYHYLREAILLVLNDITLLSAITTKLYPDIACRHNTTSPRVERAIRHAIETAWINAKVSVLDGLFGYTINEKKGKPTNGEFIAMIADKVRIEKSFVD